MKFSILNQKNVKHPVSFCIPAVPSKCVRTAEELYLDRPYSTHWEDELLLQASQAFSKEQEEEDTLLLVVSQDYEKTGTTTGQLIPGKHGPLVAMLHCWPNG